jgi:hypothetical protein
MGERPRAAPSKRRVSVAGLSRVGGEDSVLDNLLDNGQGVAAIASLCIYKYQLVTQISRNHFSVWPNLVWS